MMENNHLSDKEIDYLWEHREPINDQLELIREEITENGHSSHAAHLIAELCMYHFTLGVTYDH